MQPDPKKNAVKQAEEEEETTGGSDSDSVQPDSSDQSTSEEESSSEDSEDEDEITEVPGWTRKTMPNTHTGPGIGAYMDGTQTKPTPDSAPRTPPSAPDNPAPAHDAKLIQLQLAPGAVGAGKAERDLVVVKQEPDTGVLIKKEPNR